MNNALPLTKYFSYIISSNLQNNPINRMHLPKVTLIECGIHVSTQFLTLSPRTFSLPLDFSYCSARDGIHFAKVEPVP